MAEIIKDNGFIFPNEVKGWLDPAEGKLLFQLAQRNKELGVVVELGSYKGKSTICLAQGAQNSHDGKVFAVDLFKGNRYKQDGDFLSEFMMNIASYGVNEHVTPVEGDFLKTAQAWTQPIRLLFIDGSHKYEDAKRDFDAWERHVAAGGIIAFHDSLSHTGVTTLIEQIMRSKKFTKCKTLDSKSGLTHMIKANPNEGASESATLVALNELHILSRRKLMPRLISTLAEKTPVLNRRFI